MKHSFIDRYSERDSLVHRLDPRTKLIFSLIFVITIVLTQPDNWLVYLAHLSVLGALLLLSRVPVLHVIRHSLLIIPFVALIAVFIPFFKGGEVAGSYNIWIWELSVSDSGLQVMRNILARAWLSIITLIILTATTRIPVLLKGMEQMGLPRIMVMILSFMYRYIFILVDEVLRMRQARDSRNFGGSRRWQIQTVGGMIGTLFVRTYERGERVYAAMVARGFSGQSRTLEQLKFQPLDVYFGLCTGILIIGVSFINVYYG